MAILFLNFQLPIILRPVIELLRTAKHKLAILQYVMCVCCPLPYTLHANGYMKPRNSMFVCYTAATVSVYMVRVCVCVPFPRGACHLNYTRGCILVRTSWLASRNTAIDGQKAQVAPYSRKIETA